MGHADFDGQAKSDLGNAEVAGLSEEMELNAREYSDLAIMLLVGYIIFQIPGTMLIKKLGPSYQVSYAGLYM
jgi:fucose permease